MKLKFLILLIFVFSALYADAQCNEETKKQVDSLKASMPYPKFNVDDILYIAFINNPDVGTNNITEKDIDVKKVKIFDMRACNNIAGANSDYVLSLRGTYPIEWQYQFIDIRIEKTKYKDVSGFHSEDRFSTTPTGAKQILMKVEPNHE